MSVPHYCAVQRLTASGAVDTAGVAVIIYGYAVESGGTAAVPYFNNGSALSGSEIKFKPGPTTANQGAVQALGMGTLFPSGCWVSFDANTTAVSAFYLRA